MGIAVFAAVPIFAHIFWHRARQIAAELSEIRDRGHFIIAIKNNRPPLGFIDENR